MLDIERYNGDMKRDPESIFTDALRLSETERAALIDRLLDSLDPVAEADRQAAWDAEIAKRLADIDSGADKLTPWREVREELRGMIRGRRG
jgi:putative addiction module component (TIGR02574 family)